MSFKLTPAKPAVTRTEIVTVELATLATVTVTVPLHEALILAAVQGASTGLCPATFFKGLRNHALFEDYYALIRCAIAHGEGYENGNLSAGQFAKEFAELRRKSEEV